MRQGDLISGQPWQRGGFAKAVEERTGPAYISSVHDVTRGAGFRSILDGDRPSLDGKLLSWHHKAFSPLLSWLCSASTRILEVAPSAEQ